MRKPGYRREDVGVGHAHIGVGSFHRCHQAIYTEDLLEEDEAVGGVTISERIAKLRQELEAVSIILLDDTGQAMAQAGNIPDEVNNLAMLSSLMNVTGSTMKISQLLGG